MMRKPVTIFAALYIAIESILFAACSSVTSHIENISDPVGDGIVYYMPRRPIKISITFAAATPATPGTPAVPATGNSPAVPATPGKPEVIPPGVPSVDTVPATADRRQRFILRFENNWVGKNHANIGVNTSGLLTTSNADTTSGIATIVQNIAKALGYASALTAAAVPPGPHPPVSPCSSGRTYTMLLYPELLTTSPSMLCGFSITVTNLDGSPIDTKARPHTSRLAKTTSSHSGVFYKQELPYLVQIQDPSNGQPSQFLAFSPDLAPIAFVPVTRSFFANNQTNITLSEGIVTAVDSMTTGELVALWELPADFISSYTAAVGHLFTALGNNTQAQTTLINNQSALAVAKIKQTACASTIDANKATLDPSHLVGAGGSALATATANMNTALANIQAACR